MFLPNEEFFGRKGVCPSCGHRFVLTPVSSPADAGQKSSAPSDSQSTLDEVLGKPKKTPPPSPPRVARPVAKPPSASDPDDEVVDLDELDREDDSLSDPTPISLEQRRRQGLPKEEFPRSRPPDYRGDDETWDEPGDLSEEISLSDSVAARSRPVADSPSTNGQHGNEIFAQAEVQPRPPARWKRANRRVDFGGGGDAGDGRLHVFRHPGLSSGPGDQIPPGSIGPRGAQRPTPSSARAELK